MQISVPLVTLLITRSCPKERCKTGSSASTSAIIKCGFFFFFFPSLLYTVQKFSCVQFCLRSFFKIKELNLQPDMGNSCRGLCYFFKQKISTHFAGVLERFASLMQFHMSLTSLCDYIATMENIYFLVFWGFAIPSVTFHSSSLRI